MKESQVRMDPKDYHTFRFTSFSYQADTGQAEFNYDLLGADHSIAFTERLSFIPASANSEIEPKRLTALLTLLGAVLGASYYKAAAPDRFEISAGTITATALEYLQDVYCYGLAEFSYRAGLPALTQPEFSVQLASQDFPDLLPSTRQLHSPLVPVGGGKDSAVTVAALQKAGLNVTGFVVNPNPIHLRVANLIGKAPVVVSRKIDPYLFELNRSGALNGHVPVTAMVSLIAITQSLLLGLGPVVMSNESSASEPTLDWAGVAVNHQWSKSLEAEAGLQDAISSQAGLKDYYFSLLRPFTELRIARAFSRGTEYDSLFVSCNRAFRIQGAEPSWCGDCPKCRFVFLAFAPFMSVKRLSNIFGANLYADMGQLAGFRELIGLDKHKPFECVGEEAESVVAVTLAARIPQWRKQPVIAALIAEAPELAGEITNPNEQLVFQPRAALPVPSDKYQEARDAVS